MVLPRPRNHKGESDVTVIWQYSVFRRIGVQTDNFGFSYFNRNILNVCSFFYCLSWDLLGTIFKSIAGNPY